MAMVKALAMVDFPAPDNPVKKTVNPEQDVSIAQQKCRFIVFITLLRPGRVALEQNFSDSWVGKPLRDMSSSAQ